MIPIGTLTPSLLTFAVLYAFLTLPLIPSLSSTALDDESNKDLQALLCLKSRLSNNARSLASWNESLQFCTWPGITCGKRHESRVTALHLESLDLNGHLPPCIGNLTFLTRIHLSNNRLNGEIPIEVGHLRRLVYINLSSNNLTGVIPNSLSSCSSLEILNLGNNFLQGEIPLGLSNCSNLKRIVLHENMLHGGIPDGFTALDKLSVLFAHSNNLSGNIPHSLGSVSSLTYVVLANNSLTGGIPPVLANCSSLQWLDLRKNHIGGEIPPALFNSSSLQAINLAENNFFGSIPPLSDLSSIQFLYLSYNNLSGSIPSSLGNSTSLYSLLLAWNELQGSIPSSLSRIPYLEELEFTGNNLTGTVPLPLYNMSTLTFLGMAENNLIGELPQNIGYTLKSIEMFILQGNKFHGQIPKSLAKATNLQLINLRENAFKGIIPYFGSLPNLTILDLGKNQLEAGDWTFLPALAHTQLAELYLDANNLQGSLPSSTGDLPQSMKILVLTSNFISGTIPQEIEQLRNLVLLQIDHNLLTGNLPDSLGNLSNLLILSLAQNSFYGKIPLSIGKLNQLTELYLQDNSFSGLIPKALGQCQKLDILNLSCNSLEGTIPKELFTISTLSEGLDLSHNRLSGPIPVEVGSLINLGPLNISNNKLSGEIPSALGDCVRLEYLNMEGNVLNGQIPKSFSALRGIIQMDLSRNNLSGQIPEFFETLSSMVLLNLSFNNLEGPIPSNGIFQNASKVFLQGNKELCAISPLLKLPLCQISASKNNHTSYIAKVVGLSVFCLVFLSCLAVFFLKRKKAKNPTDPSYKKLEKLTYADLVKVTNNFSPTNLIGSGKYGSVYVGKFDAEAHAVAIKVFKLDQLGAPKSFIAECEALRNTRHRNLVRVITACSTFDPTGHEFKALVLEYMVNGNLECWLHPTSYKNRPRNPVRLSTRIEIALDMAAALDYLHNRCMPPIVHCDLKPSNVLLDNAMGARVSDFGLAKFLHSNISSTSDRSTSLLGPRGSIGYIAPGENFLMHKKDSICLFCKIICMFLLTVFYSDLLL